MIPHASRTSILKVLFPAKMHLKKLELQILQYWSFWKVSKIPPVPTSDSFSYLYNKSPVVSYSKPPSILFEIHRLDLSISLTPYLTFFSNFQSKSLKINVSLFIAPIIPFLLSKFSPHQSKYLQIITISLSSRKVCQLQTSSTSSYKYN